MHNLLKGLPESVRETIIAGTPLAVVIILFILVINFGVPRVTDVRSKISSAQTLDATLTQKLSILQSFAQNPAANSVNAAVTALPTTNPSAVVISQLKNTTSCCGVILSNVKSGGSSTGSTGTAVQITNTNFLVVGPRDSVTNYLKNVELIAPISVINSVKINENGGLTSATVSLLSYWAPYPKTIPSVTQPITDLTSSEKLILSQIGSLTQPAVVQGLPTESGVNPNPFGQ
jgi:hypothetical protein